MIFECLLIGLILAVATTFLCFKWRFSHWKRKDIPYLTPTIPLGNLGNPLSIKKGFIGMLSDAHRVFRSQGRRFGGIFILHKPVLIFTDPDLIKIIWTTDFHHFVNHGNFVDEKKDPLGANLLNLENEKWRNLRMKLAPTFSSGKMKMMYSQIMNSAKQMVEHIGNLSSQNEALDIKEVMSCYSTDVIGSCVFGIDCNSFKNPDAEFQKYGRCITASNLMVAARMFLTFIVPELQKLFSISYFQKDVREFLARAFREVINRRRTGNFKRNDFIQLLVELENGRGINAKSLSMDEMLAHSLIFFAAGLETVAINLSFCLYELALNEDIQGNLRREVFEVLQRHNGELTYEAVMDMKYLEQVIDESLRKYPPIPFLNRKCTKDYVIPETEITIEKGTSVMVSLLALQRDPEYFPDPEKFDPNRFSKEGKLNIRPFTFLPFGEGPRICIGRRFALLEVKVGLAMLLKNFRILPHESTPKVVELYPNSVFIITKDPIILRSQFL